MVSRCVGLTVAALLLTSSGAFAQGAPRLELAGSYQFLQPFCPLGCEDYPVGWQASASVGLNSWFGIVGEVGRNGRTITSTSTFIPFPPYQTSPVTNMSHSVIYDVLAGPRVGKQLGSRVRLLGEVLFGAEHSDYLASVSISIPRELEAVGTTFTPSSTRWTWQPGAGIDLAMSRRWAARVGVDYRVGASPTSLNGALAFSSGIVFRPFGAEEGGHH